jgi:hypothetical protein
MAWIDLGLSSEMTICFGGSKCCESATSRCQTQSIVKR